MYDPNPTNLKHPHSKITRRNSSTNSARPVAYRASDIIRQTTTTVTALASFIIICITVFFFFCFLFIIFATPIPPQKSKNSSFHSLRICFVYILSELSKYRKCPSFVYTVHGTVCTTESLLRTTVPLYCSSNQRRKRRLSLRVQAKASMPASSKHFTLN